MVIPVFTVGRAKSIQGSGLAMGGGDRRIMLVAQKDGLKDEPAAEDMFTWLCHPSCSRYRCRLTANLLRWWKGQQRALVKQVADEEFPTRHL